MLFLFLGLQRMFMPNGPTKPEPRKPKDGEVVASGAASAGKSETKPDETTPAALPSSQPERVVSLGSMDPAKGYRLLMTISSRGAGLERVELVDEKKEDRFRYRALEHRGGYLGYLGWRTVDAGVLITTVPDASPAALATCPDTSGGLQVGDILNAIDGKEVVAYEDIQRVLSKSKAGSPVELTVVRSRDQQPVTLKFQAVLSQPPLDVLRTEEYLAERAPGNLERMSCLTTLAAVGNSEIPIGKRTMPGLAGTLTDNWELMPLEVPGGQGVECRLPLTTYLQDAKIPADLVMVKRYRLLPLDTAAQDAVAANAEAYCFDYETLIENRSGQAVDVSLRHEGLAGVTLEGWWYSVKVSPYFFRGAGQRDVRYGDSAGNHSIVLTRSIYDRELKSSQDPGLFVDAGGSPAARSLRYVGLDAQYFAAAFLPHPDAPDGLNNLHQAGSDAVARPDNMVSSQAQAMNTAFWFDTTKKTLATGESFSTRYRIFAGPKDSRVLAHHGLDRFIEYGWIPWISKPLSGVLYFFYSIFRNYGIAIILLTLLVRCAMFPLGRQAAINAQRMQELQPEMKRINDLYKDDMQKRAAAMQELYSKHNFRPLSSCLPLFVQIPIFMGLYRCLSVDISLRQEPLIPGLSWCSNLAGPDMLFDWSSWMPEIIAGRGTGYLGPYFNLLPVLTIALFLVQQKILMPKATDEQTQMTQNMMQVMTVVMGVLFFKVPSGLCIYFITSSLWSLAERKLVKRLVPVKPASGTTAAPVTPAPAPATRAVKEASKSQPPSGLAGKLAELRELLDKPAVRSSTQRRDKDKKRKN